MKQIRIKKWHLYAFQLALICLSILINQLFLEKKFSELTLNGIRGYYQIIVGLATGLLVVLLVLKYLEQVKKKNFNLTHLEILYRSNIITIIITCAITAIAEEFFFRAIIQSAMGIIFTSVLFSLAHSQFWLNLPINIDKILFGAFLVFMGFVFGFLYNSIGYISAVCSHFIFDFVLLLAFKAKNSTTT